MKETELKLHPCQCGGEMEIKKVAKNGGMDGTYWDWALTCNKCGLTKYYAADGFYGRKYKTFEEVVDDWNKKKRGRTDVLDKIRAEIKEWYWQADKQALAKDPCVVDAMVDLFIRTIDKYKAESEVQDADSN